MTKKKAKKATSRAARKSKRTEPITPKDLLADPTGSCRYADAFGQIQCESPVTKSYCDDKNGQFVEGGRC